MCHPEGLPLFPGNRDDHLSHEHGVENSLWGLHFWSTELKEKKLSAITTSTYDGYLAHNLLTQMLVKHPLQRPTIGRILSHPFVSRKKVIRLVGEPPMYDIYLCYRDYRTNNHHHSHHSHNHSHNNNHHYNHDVINDAIKLHPDNTHSTPIDVIDENLDILHVEKLYQLLTAKGFKLYWDKRNGRNLSKEEGSTKSMDEQPEQGLEKGMDQGVDQSVEQSTVSNKDSVKNKDKDYSDNNKGKGKLYDDITQENEDEHIYHGLANCRVFVPLISRNAINHPTHPTYNFAKFTSDALCDQVIISTLLFLMMILLFNIVVILHLSHLPTSLPRFSLSHYLPLFTYFSYSFSLFLSLLCRSC